MKDKLLILLMCIGMGLIWFSIPYVLKKDVKEENVSFQKPSDNIINCDISITTADAVNLECTVQYFHNESRPEMITPTIDVINSCLKVETKLLVREYSMIDFLHNKEEIANRIRAIPQQSKTKISSDFSWEILNVTIKL